MLMFLIDVFQISSPSGNHYVRRRVGEEYHPQCITPTVKHGGGSIMIWGCMTSEGGGEVHVCEGRMNGVCYVAMLEQVLESSIVRSFDPDTEEYYFQQDNASCHKACLVP